jgi:two-component system sensor histidine kinase TtrS
MISFQLLKLGTGWLMHRWRLGLTLILLKSFLMVSAIPAFPQTPKMLQEDQQRTARIGVLAYRGVQASRVYWRPLADYLTESVPGWKFVLVPMNLVTAPQQIESQSVDFVITNPGHFVDLAERFGLSALATREKLNERTSGRLLEFGSVIFVRSDSQIRNLADLKGRSIAATSRDAFGGFQIAWRELQDHGIDIFEDVGSVHYMGFPMDALPSAVIGLEVDAAIVRTGLLESLESEGRLKLENIRILNSNMQLDYPYQISSHLYPEWPFASLPNVPKTLRETVLHQLLKTQDKHVSERFGISDIWTAPLSYEGVRALVGAYRNRLTKTESSWRTWALPITAAIALIALLVLMGWIINWIRRLQTKNTIVEQPARVELDSPENELVIQKFEALTSREKQILGMVCEGLSTKLIAHELNISPKTVEFHRTNLLQKTEAGTTAHLVQLATRFGFDQGYSLV